MKRSLPNRASRRIANSGRPRAFHSPNRTFYDRISRAYDLLCDACERPAREAALNLLAPRPGERVLEVGCGTGSDLLEISRRVGQLGRAVGIDLSRGMLEMARRKVAAKGRITFAQADARRLPFASRDFDAAYASFTLETFAGRDLAAVLREIRRVLRPGGRVGFVSVSRRPSEGRDRAARRTYLWFHRHFPHIVDCRPIDVDRVLSRGQFTLVRKEEREIWGIPVTAALALNFGGP